MTEILTVIEAGLHQDMYRHIQVAHNRRSALIEDAEGEDGPARAFTLNIIRDSFTAMAARTNMQDYLVSFWGKHLWAFDRVTNYGSEFNHLYITRNALYTQAIRSFATSSDTDLEFWLTCTNYALEHPHCTDSGSQKTSFPQEEFDSILATFLDSHRFRPGETRESVEKTILSFISWPHWLITKAEGRVCFQPYTFEMLVAYKILTSPGTKTRFGETDYPQDCAIYFIGSTSNDITMGDIRANLISTGLNTAGDYSRLRRSVSITAERLFCDKPDVFAEFVVHLAETVGIGYADEILAEIGNMYTHLQTEKIPGNLPIFDRPPHSKIIQRTLGLARQALDRIRKDSLYCDRDKIVDYKTLTKAVTELESTGNFRHFNETLCSKTPVTAIILEILDTDASRSDPYGKRIEILDPRKDPVMDKQGKLPVAVYLLFAQIAGCSKEDAYNFAAFGHLFWLLVRQMDIVLDNEETNRSEATIVKKLGRDKAISLVMMAMVELGRLGTEHAHINTSLLENEGHALRGNVENDNAGMAITSEERNRAVMLMNSFWTWGCEGIAEAGGRPKLGIHFREIVEVTMALGQMINDAEDPGGSKNPPKDVRARKFSTLWQGIRNCGVLTTEEANLIKKAFGEGQEGKVAHLTEAEIQTLNEIGTRYTPEAIAHLRGSSDDPHSIEGLHTRGLKALQAIEKTVPKVDGVLDSKNVLALKGLRLSLEAMYQGVLSFGSNESVSN